MILISNPEPLMSLQRENPAPGRLSGLGHTVAMVTSAVISGAWVTLAAAQDHAAAAGSVGLKMPKSTVLVFGNPLIGTPVFIKRPTLAIEESHSTVSRGATPVPGAAAAIRPATAATRRRTVNIRLPP